MTVYENIREFHIDEPTAVAIGKFDGDHIGHQYLFEELRKVAAENGLKTLVFTFNYDSREIPSFASKLNLITNAERRAKLKEEKIDYIIEYPFDTNTAAIEADDFLRTILIGQCNMKYIVGGYDISFGKNRAGNADMLRKYSPIYGFGTSIIGKLKNDHGEEISSTMIRNLIEEGKLTEAYSLLDRR